jgi:ATPase subunit of ABC transporter with duplicated ATPase domains
MIHKPIIITNLELSFPHKICFENFSCNIDYGSRIAIIGRNGSGKTTLLKMLAKINKDYHGTIVFPEDLITGYVPQVIEDFNDISGGQRLNKAITQALSSNPNILLLDEPTNHLDNSNRKSLMKMLNNYAGTLIIVSHDRELIRSCIDTIFHIDNGKVHIFSGNYDDYIREIKQKRLSLESEISKLNNHKKDMHDKLMNEQNRAAKSKSKGKKSKDNNKWSKVAGNTKEMEGEMTSGNRRSAINSKKQNLIDDLSSLRLPEIIVPKFSITAADIGIKTIVQISNANVGYVNSKKIHYINFNAQSNSRIAITGDNGSGKSTLIKAILEDDSIIKDGSWIKPKKSDIGYLDQHYGNLDPNLSVCDMIQSLRTDWLHTDIRKHLNDFLFRKNEEVNSLCKDLSGGEKARLSLACIAATTPKILILDEITNNLDLETKEHIIEVLKEYPGCIIAISHESDFLSAIGINEFYEIKDNRLNLMR